jgi:hypothetical protein
MVHHGRAASWCLVLLLALFHKGVGEVSIAGESGVPHEVVHHTWNVGLGCQGGGGRRRVCFFPQVSLLVLFLSEGKQILQAVLALPCLMIRCLGRRNVPVLQPRGQMLLIGEA